MYLVNGNKIWYPGIFPGHDIIKRSKVDSIVEVRQKYRQEQKDHELQELEKLKQGQYDLQEEFEQMAAQKSTLK